jgi:Mg2+-importing ATPase
MDDEALARVVEEVNVFCRLTPAQKNRVISALKNNGHVVGFLGDGINDAPSLKNAGRRHLGEQRRSTSRKRPPT